MIPYVQNTITETSYRIFEDLFSDLGGHRSDQDFLGELIFVLLSLLIIVFSKGNVSFRDFFLPKDGPPPNLLGAPVVGPKKGIYTYTLN